MENKSGKNRSRDFSGLKNRFRESGGLKNIYPYQDSLKHSKQKMIAAACAAVALILLVCCTGIFRPKVDTSQGEQYVASLCQRDPAGVLEHIQLARNGGGIVSDGAAASDATVPSEHAASDGTVPSENAAASGNVANAVPSDQREALFRNQAADLYAQIETGEIRDLSPEELAIYQQRFSDTVLVGDSLAQAVYDNGFLDGNHVYFQRGASISQLGEELEEAAAMLPSKIIFYTGLNDTDFFPDVNDFCNAYVQKVQEAQALCPGAEIYICSMCSPSNELGEVRPDLARAPEYDAMLRAICDSTPATYIDLKWMVRQDLYLEDGIHFNYWYYCIWMQYVAMNLGI